jgi:putative endonuclease
MKEYYVSILAAGRRGVFYIGVTNDPVRRTAEHKQEPVPGFTKIHHIHRLVYYYQTGDVHSGLAREKQLKKRNRAWKIKLIEETNPNWKDLYIDIAG